MAVDTYLLFNGKCAEAFKFYEQTLGGKIEGIMTHGESPMADQVAPDWKDKVMHVRMKVGDRILMGSDAPPQHYEKPQGFSVSCGVKDVAEAERVFKALSQGGAVTMPLQKTFWSAAFAMFTDRYGIPWMVNCEKTS
jgi:PhnB protein